MYAIIETGGKQYRVAEGQVIKVEKLEAEVGSEVAFDKVLSVVKDGDAKIGTPVVTGAKVTAEVLEQGKGKKIVVVHYKPKKNIRKKNGHRQPFTAVRIKSITL